jgi:Zn-dependent M28 family amino/carboxypeptidase
MKKLLILIPFSPLFWSCSPKDPNVENTTTDTSAIEAKVPVKKMEPVKFNEDSAYYFVGAQVKFGPRVPGTASHKNAAQWLAKTLATYCDTLYEQRGTVTTFKNENLAFVNIIGSFNPQSKERILLSAHWDTRPQADEDKVMPFKPSDGANDGASGVGVLLEIARQLHSNRPGIGIDIILFDVEDGGDRRGSSESWCLGSQYWSKTPHVPNYTAKFGILLDMVGAKDATFPMELHSLDFARDYVYFVWQTGQSLGYGNYFTNNKGGMITDDHYYINSILGVRTLDIIQYNTTTQTGFGDFWHTQKDNMSIIDKNTLKAVGHTVIEVIYRQNNAGA